MDVVRGDAKVCHSPMLLLNQGVELAPAVAVAGAAKKTRAAGGEAGVGELRPKRARITPVDP